ncbi:ribonuclease domain-containing protein [Uliginosibacterium sediminicola]|uniref:Ribonuclease domain-containing protein n=1 Tax=Uliginosibacterium sediminicola TaxID=2024550 RepID=A0ABU9Z3T1_9RHOO
MIRRILSAALFAVLLCCLPAGARDLRDAASALATISVSELPPEAQQTLQLIRNGGPFPYRRDGIEFQNREKRLPRRERGYYREYTVPTPGSADRGARRIVTGQPDEAYYTADHYRSFRRITR